MKTLQEIQNLVFSHFAQSDNEAVIVEVTMSPLDIYIEFENGTNKNLSKEEISKIVW